MKILNDIYFKINSFMLDFNIENLLNSTIGYVGFLNEAIEHEYIK